MVTKKAIDFSNVKDQGNFNPKQVPAGDYLAKIVKVEDGQSKGDKGFQYVFTIKLTKFAAYSYPYYCKLQENQLWKLRNLFISAGINVPKKRITVDPSKLLGKMIGVTMGDDEYEGKMKSVIDSVFPASELGDDVVTDSAADDDGYEDDDTGEDYADEGEDESTDDSADEAEEEDETEDEAPAEDFSALDRTELKKRIKALKPDFVFKKSHTDDDLRDTLTDLVGDSGSDDDDELEELDIEDL